MLVYPQLAATAPAQWRVVHDRHSRLIAPVVGLVYLGALAGCALALREERSWPVLLAVGCQLLAMALTAALAAPLHERLGTADDAARSPLLRRLLLVDRLRLATTLLGLALVVAVS